MPWRQRRSDAGTTSDKRARDTAPSACLVTSGLGWSWLATHGLRIRCRGRGRVLVVAGLGLPDLARIFLTITSRLRQCEAWGPDGDGTAASTKYVMWRQDKSEEPWSKVEQFVYMLALTAPSRAMRAVCTASFSSKVGKHSAMCPWPLCHLLVTCSAALHVQHHLTGSWDSYISVSLCHECAEDFGTCSSNRKEGSGTKVFCTGRIVKAICSRIKLFILVFYECP